MNTAGNWHNLQENNVANVTKPLVCVLLENKIKKKASSGLVPAYNETARVLFKMSPFKQDAFIVTCNNSDVI